MKRIIITVAAVAALSGLALAAFAGGEGYEPAWAITDAAEGEVNFDRSKYPDKPKVLDANGNVVGYAKKADIFNYDLDPGNIGVEAVGIPVYSFTTNTVIGYIRGGAYVPNSKVGLK